eukprot:scaffold988_cov105-Isochrysis_galbana.AAC.10
MGFPDSSRHLSPHYPYPLSWLRRAAVAVSSGGGRDIPRVVELKEAGTWAPIIVAGSGGSPVLMASAHATTRSMKRSMMSS